MSDERELTSDSFKNLTLRIHDLHCQTLATSYDLEDPASRLQSTHDLRRLFLQLVRVLEPTLFVEAGAHEAGVSRRVAALLPETDVHAFEANPYTFERFAKEIAAEAPSVKYQQMALSDTDGTATFNVMAEESGAPAADANGSLMQHEAPPHGFVQVTVPTRTLDGLLSERMGSRSAWWIDVEGASKQVLSGATRLLDTADVVQIELEDRAFWGQAWLRPEINDFMYDRGLVPVARDFQARYLYNVVYLRDALRDRDRVRWALALHASSADRARTSRVERG